MAVVVAVAALGACGSDDDPGGDVTDAAFEATVEVDGDALAISYRVENTSGGALFVLNRVPVEDTSSDRSPLESEPDQVYVTSRGDGLVEVAKRTFARPEGVELYAPYLLDVTVLGEGEALEESLRVPLPLEGRSLYDSDELPDDVERVVFCVGVVPVPEGREVGPSGSVHQTEHGLRPQELLCSDEVELPATAG